MSEEEIKQNAAIYTTEYYFETPEQFYIAGAKSRDKEIEELEMENAELEAKNEANENGAKKYAECDFKTNDQLTKAKEIILMLYNAGRDVLMCLNEEKSFSNLSDAINDKRIEQFLKEIEE